MGMLGTKLSREVRTPNPTANGGFQLTRIEQGEEHTFRYTLYNAWHCCKANGSIGHHAVQLDGDLYLQKT